MAKHQLELHVVLFVALCSCECSVPRDLCMLKTGVNYLRNVFLHLTFPFPQAPGPRCQSLCRRLSWSHCHCYSLCCILRPHCRRYRCLLLSCRTQVDFLAKGFHVPLEDRTVGIVESGVEGITNGKNQRRRKESREMLWPATPKRKKRGGEGMGRYGHDVDVLWCWRL